MASSSTSAPYFPPAPSQRRFAAPSNPSPPLASSNLPSAGTKLCSFYQNGSCRFGDQCRFAHVAAAPGQEFSSELDYSETNSASHQQHSSQAQQHRGFGYNDRRRSSHQQQHQQQQHHHHHHQQQQQIKEQQQQQHSPPDSPVVAKPSFKNDKAGIDCRYWLNGETCRFGDECRYEHRNGMFGVGGSGGGDSSTPINNDSSQHNQLSVQSKPRKTSWAPGQESTNTTSSRSNYRKTSLQPLPNASNTYNDASTPPQGGKPAAGSFGWSRSRFGSVDDADWRRRPVNVVENEETNEENQYVDSQIQGGRSENNNQQRFKGGDYSGNRRKSSQFHPHSQHHQSMRKIAEERRTTAGGGEEEEEVEEGEGEELNGKPQRVCRNWEQEGSCRFGDRCRFDHPGAIKSRKPSRANNRRNSGPSTSGGASASTTTSTSTAKTAAAKEVKASSNAKITAVTTKANHRPTFSSASWEDIMDEEAETGLAFTPEQAILLDGTTATTSWHEDGSWTVLNEAKTTTTTTTTMVEATAMEATTMDA